MNVLSIVFGILLLPITLLASWYVLGPNEELVVMYWGALAGVRTRPGLYFLNLWSRRLIRVSTKQTAIELHKTTVADANGNPIIMAAICTYRVASAASAALNVEDYAAFIRAQAIAVIKQIASKYPYESPDGHCPKTEAVKIGTEMVTLLQAKVDSAGLSVLSFELSDLTYAPEIAPQMLVRQQAQALIGARRVIVEGAVQIVEDALERLRAKGIAINSHASQRLVTNLLVVICGDAKITPTFAIEDEENSDNNDALREIARTLEEIRANTAKEKK